MSIYITNKTYVNINLTKFELLKPSCSGDISILILKEDVEQTYCLDFHPQNTHTSCVYFEIKFSGLSPIYPNVTLRS